jgi:hypothetical protein
MFFFILNSRALNRHVGSQLQVCINGDAAAAAVAAAAAAAAAHSCVSALGFSSSRKRESRQSI